MMIINKDMAATEHVSKALTGVWEWKQKAFEELQNVAPEKRMENLRLNTQTYIDAILMARKNKEFVNPKQD